MAKTPIDAQGPPELVRDIAHVLLTPEQIQQRVTADYAKLKAKTAQ